MKLHHYAPGTVGWLKYGRSDSWFKVEVVCRIEGTHTFEVRRASNNFVVGSADVLVVVGG